MISRVRIFLPAMQGYRPKRPGEVRWDCMALEYLPALIKLTPRLVSYTLPGVDLLSPPWEQYADYFITPVEPVYNIVIGPPSVLPAMHTPMLCNIAITGVDGMVRQEGHVEQLKGWTVLLPSEGVYPGEVVKPEDFEKWWFKFTMERS